MLSPNASRVWRHGLLFHGVDLWHDHTAVLLMDALHDGLEPPRLDLHQHEQRHHHHSQLNKDARDPKKQQQQKKPCEIIMLKNWKLE